MLSRVEHEKSFINPGLDQTVPKEAGSPLCAFPSADVGHTAA